VIFPLAYVPFLDPLPGVTHYWWVLVAPLTLGIAMSWKAVRGPSLAGGLGPYWRAVATMTIQTILAVVGIAVGLFLLVQVLLPRLPAE